jgi:hypothetical protein
MFERFCRRQSAKELEPQQPLVTYWEVTLEAEPTPRVILKLHPQVLAYLLEASGFGDTLRTVPDELLKDWCIDLAYRALTATNGREVTLEDYNPETRKESWHIGQENADSATSMPVMPPEIDGGLFDPRSNPVNFEIMVVYPVQLHEESVSYIALRKQLEP